MVRFVNRDLGGDRYLVHSHASWRYIGRMAAHSSGDAILSLQDAESLAREAFGRDGVAWRLPGWDGQNFRLDCEDGSRFVLKVTRADRDAAPLEAQLAALQWLEQRAPHLNCPRVVSAKDRAELVPVNQNGTHGAARLLSFVQGTPMADVRNGDPRLFRAVGAYLGALDRALVGFDHPGLHRDHLWDLANAPRVIAEHIRAIPDPHRVTLVQRHVSRVAYAFERAIAQVRTAVIHNDGNDHNILLDTREQPIRVAGIIDFGDLVASRLVFEVAIAATYAMLDSPDPIGNAVAVVNGYHEVYPLTSPEIELLYGCIVLRLCTSVCLSASRSRETPDDPYLTVSEAPAWRLLEQLASTSPYRFSATMFAACNMKAAQPTALQVGGKRATYVSPALSLSYREPLHIVAGSMQYLYDAQGKEYLDTVNNVCHVGHCHPRVVTAVQRQVSTLNTNTRYLYRFLGEYAERLCATLPDPLAVCYFVCSGSEANDLALRLARTHTGARDVVVLEGAYHGNLSSLIDMSPYKHGGPGGAGPPDWVHVASLPDTYRGAYRDEETAGPSYADDVRRCVREIQDRGRAPAAFFCESLPSCAGQIALPIGYLQQAYSAVRDAGGLCVADEVQVGFGRVGSAFWGFQLQGVVPDIVTLGKPIGNGFPMAAVVTTWEIARSFETGMEYFNTFGGNPVACVTGLAVLDVIEDEELQTNARELGEYFKIVLNQLQTTSQLVGDVRGEGLFLGIELVVDATSQEPAPHYAQQIVEGMKKRGVLASRDGRFNNVLKIKPPLCVTRTDIDRYVEAAGKEIGDLGRQ